MHPAPHRYQQSCRYQWVPGDSGEAQHIIAEGLCWGRQAALLKATEMWLGTHLAHLRDTAQEEDHFDIALAMRSDHPAFCKWITHRPDCYWAQYIPVWIPWAEMGQPKSSETVRGEEPVMLMLGGLLVFFPLQQTETSPVFFSKQ